MSQAALPVSCLSSQYSARILASWREFCSGFIFSRKPYVQTALSHRNSIMHKQASNIKYVRNLALFSMSNEGGEGEYSTDFITGCGGGGNSILWTTRLLVLVGRKGKGKRKKPRSHPSPEENTRKDPKPSPILLPPTRCGRRQGRIHVDHMGKK